MSALFTALMEEETKESLAAMVIELRSKLNTPELEDFAKGVVLEAAHQRERWGPQHDEGKTPADWFWLIGYLAGKALHSAVAGDTPKLKHHLITTAAALNNWHAQVIGASNMRPGISAQRAVELGGENA